MRSPAKEIKMTSYDDLFNMDGQNMEESVDKIVYLPLSNLHTPKNHPFKVNDDAAMQEMTESVKQSGVLSPGIARPLENGGYELLAGNRRKRASELAGLDQMPIIIKNLTDDEAIILMVDSNLQREELLPSEKAFAYKLKLEAMKRQGMRTDLTTTPMGQKLSVEIVGEQNGDSREQVRRYIRLTELTSDLLELVDEKKIAFRPAVELSYLTQDEQRILYDVIDSDEVFPSIKQAQDLRHYSKEGRFNADIVMVILNQEKPMESKRLGLCAKTLVVVPNHITEQFGAEWLQLYPAANILVATKKDFETKNRRKFCGRIATGEYDAVIIGHSQLEKIPVSVERQQHILESQIAEIIEGIREAKAARSENYTIKQMEKTRKTLEAKLKKLNDQSKKDNIVTFEELGVDRLMVDEAHYFKNLFLVTKMRNVSGIAQTEAQKSSDLFMKCRYLDELTGGKGIVFATGTPISNSMVELYTMQRYLQYGITIQR